MAGHGGVHGAGVLPKAAHSDGVILPVKTVVLQLGRQSQMGSIIFGGNDKPRGIPVNAVDDARPQLSVDSGKAISAVI